MPIEGPHIFPAKLPRTLQGQDSLPAPPDSDPARQDPSNRRLLGVVNVDPVLQSVRLTSPLKRGLATLHDCQYLSPNVLDVPRSSRYDDSLPLYRIHSRHSLSFA